MKRLVATFDGTTLKVDPQFCDHKNAKLISSDYDGNVYHCPDCDSSLNEDGEIIRSWYGLIPYLEEHL
jgi:hypothetical protein